jgi:uncharacterized protein YqfB (UPF0267 family)
MRAAEIVDRLAADIPLYTAGFSSAVAITSITPSGLTATAITAEEHGLADGQDVAIIGADAPVEIDIGTFIRVGSQAVFETLQDHDLTLSQRDIISGGKTVILSGAVEPEFNGTFQMISTVNRRKITIAVDDSGPTTITGSPIVENANGGLFNGLFTSTLISPISFSYQLPNSYTLPAAGSPLAQTDIRILSVVDIDQYLNDIYTKQIIGNDHLVVALGDVTQSKDRGEPTDANSSSGGQRSFTPTLIQSFAVYIIANATQDLTASDIRDKCESEYVPAIFQSVLRAEFDTGFTYSQFRSTFTGHGLYAYSDVTAKSKALYVHEVTFEQLAKLAESDAVGPDSNVAMRDTTFTISSSLGTGTMAATIDHDEEPLP